MTVLSPQHMEVLQHLAEGWVGPDCSEKALGDSGEEDLLGFLVAHNYVACFSRLLPVSVAGCVEERRFIYMLTQGGADVAESWAEAYKPKEPA